MVSYPAALKLQSEHEQGHQHPHAEACKERSRHLDVDAYEFLRDDLFQRRPVFPLKARQDSVTLQPHQPGKGVKGYKTQPVFH